jgi:hypothetical protein
MFISKYPKNSPDGLHPTPRASLVPLDLTLEDVQKDSDAALAPSR